MSALFPGVGDVCSFAQMDVKKHGNPMVRYQTLSVQLQCIAHCLLQFLSDELTEATDVEQAEDGKTEKSLLHFKVRCWVVTFVCEYRAVSVGCVGEISNMEANANRRAISHEC